MNDVAGNTTGWDGNFDSVPPDTLVLVRKDSLDKPTLESEMKRVSELGHDIRIRYDRWRKFCRFTILLDNERLCDTDYPVGALQGIK